MKSTICAVLVAAIFLPSQLATSQVGSSLPGPGWGPRLAGPTARLIGDNSAFVANLEIQTRTASTNDQWTLPGRLFCSEGKSRFEIDVAFARGGRIAPQMVTQLKGLGMDKMVIISRPDKQVSYVVYPATRAYVETPLSETARGDYNVVNTDLARATLDGQPCVQSRAVISNSGGAQQQATVWYATGLKRFPLRIETPEAGGTNILHFRNVSLSKQAAALFDVPAGFTKHDNVMTAMQQAMMRQKVGLPGTAGGTGKSTRPPQANPSPVQK